MDTAPPSNTATPARRLSDRQPLVGTAPPSSIPTPGRRLSDRQPPVGQEVRPFADPAAAASPSLLVIDDDPGSVQVLGLMLAGLGHLRFALSGVSNQTYRLERSTNFVIWTPFQTNRVTGGELNVVDSSAINLPRAFYRATTVP